MILRTILAASVVVVVLVYYRNREEVPTFSVAVVAASLAGQVFLVRKDNLLPFFRAWLMGGSIAAFMYPLDFVKTDAYDPPSGMSYVAAILGCLAAGVWSLTEGRSFWNGRRISAMPRHEETE